MTKNTMPHFMTDSQVEAKVSNSIAQSRARRAEASAEWSKPKKAVALLGIAAVGAAVSIPVGAFTKQSAESIYHSVFAGPNLEQSLKEPVSEVKADLKDGDINPDDVTKVTIDDTQTAWNAANTLAGSEQPTEPLADIIQAQQGDAVSPGNKVFLPSDAIDLHKPAQP